jgi:hypothetical protein
MRVGDLVIVANLGEMKVFKAMPRDLEAEAGLKPNNVKLQQINVIDYIQAHWKIQDMVTDFAGRFKSDAKNGANAGERHELQRQIEENVIKAIAEDIAKAVSQYSPEKYFLALPNTS